MTVSKENWLKLMDSFDLARNDEAFEYLIKKYSEKHRFYHNVNHIDDCLSKLVLSGRHNRELELAIWYHDIIYDSYRKDNELKSAEKMKLLFVDGKHGQELVERIFRLIMITKHDEEPRTEDEALIMDVDISILGRSKEEYDNYTLAIRKEYKFVPFFLYKKKRREIMTNFTKKERLYYTDHFYNLFEAQARKNISEEIESLS